MAWKTKTKSFLIFLSDAPGHFSKKVNKKSPIPIPIEPPFENIQSLKDLHFGCHFIKVFLKVLEQQRHLSPKKSQAKFCVISLKKRKKNFSFFVLTRASTKIRIKRYLSLQFCITSRKYPRIQKTFLIVRIFLFP